MKLHNLNNPNSRINSSPRAYKRSCATSSVADAFQKSALRTEKTILFGSNKLQYPSDELAGVLNKGLKLIKAEDSNSEKIHWLQETMEEFCKRATKWNSKVLPSRPPEVVEMVSDLSHEVNNIFMPLYLPSKTKDLSAEQLDNAIKGVFNDITDTHARYQYLHDSGLVSNTQPVINSFDLAMEGPKEAAKRAKIKLRVKGEKLIKESKFGTALHTQNKGYENYAIFNNVIGNAIKYTPEGGRVDISFKKDEGKLLFSVKDSGYGIPPDMLEKVWNGKRASNVKDLGISGTGRGLNKVRKVVQMQGAGFEPRAISPAPSKDLISKLTSLLGIKDKNAGTLIEIPLKLQE